MSSLRSIITRTLGAYVRFEVWIFLVLGALFFISLFVLGLRFRGDATLLVPATGGTYIEGSVGEFRPLNPWFTVTNDVNRDIVSLVFAGLLTYDPVSKTIIDDLATYEVSADGRIYTVRLKDDIHWHDATEESPHPVTADDILFTYQTIQDPEFPNPLLRQNFRGVTIEKLDERTVQFRLDRPYSFFPSNLTLGLLPARAFAGIPVRSLDQALDFGFSPIGAGPYRFKTVVQTDLSTEVTLERFPRSIAPTYRLDRIIFRIFSAYPSLLSDLRNLDGIRLVPHTDQGMPALPHRFLARNYSLPQYVALFFNLDRPIVQDRQLRLGLQLGTNKQDLVDGIGQAAIVDTPLLEIDMADWRYQYDPAAAQGALFESDWFYPEKIRLQRLLEQREANDTGILHTEPVQFLDTGAVLRVSGSGADYVGTHRLNGVALRAGGGSGTWVATLPTARGGTGALRLGENLLRLTDESGRIVDSFYLLRTNNAIAFQRAKEEQKLVTAFLSARAGEEEGVQVEHLFLEQGHLRRRRESDPVGIRQNGKGERLALTLLTAPSPASYREAAEMIRSQWAALGVDVRIDIPETRAQFEDRVLHRDYDVLLFGQSLLDNLDAYPYWHSSGVQELTDNRNDLKIDAYNLSQYTSFEADTLLETVRGNTGDDARREALATLQDVLKRDMPAVFLYSPLYAFAHREDILGVEFTNLSMHSDRFLTLHRWYVRQERVFRDGMSWWSFFPWLSSSFAQE